MDQKSNVFPVKVDISGPPPLNVIFTPLGSWGQYEESSLKESPHIRVKRFVAPDGVVNRYFCQCGGHEEHLIEGRDILTLQSLKDMGLKAPSDEMSEKMISRTRTSFDETIKPFIERHARCSVEADRIKYTIPREVMEIVMGLSRDADEKLRSGRRIDNVVIVYDQYDKPTQLMSFYNADEEWPSNDVECALKTWTIREMRRAIKRELPKAIVHVSEAWLASDKSRDDVQRGLPPSKRDDRQEVILISVLTPEFVAMGAAPIIREGGVINEGVGYTRELTLKFGAMSSRVTDGLFAVSSTPLPEASLAWQMMLALKAVAQSPNAAELADMILKSRGAKG